ncbi:MAG: protease modulator HflC [Bdellovibrionales bacterium]|nr:protease modulator HflC [Bdellovibrionales bacterium]
MKDRALMIAALAILLMIGISSSAFVVNEWEQALVIELGKHKRTIKDSGLYFKMPLTQTVVKLEKRLLEYDVDPKELFTGDRQQVVVDNYSRWKIVDPLKFYESVRTESAAITRLDDIIYSAFREVLGKHSLKELISEMRSELCEKALELSNEKVSDFGIEVVDVRIKRADLPEENEQNVFARMITERERLAKKFRAEGEEEARKIRSLAEKEARVIAAQAKKESEIIRGQGDAESTKIYARAYNQDPEFYRFVRQLETYKKTFQPGTKIVLTPGSEFLKTLKSGR